MSIIPMFATVEEELAFRLKELPELCGPIPDPVKVLLAELLARSPENRELALDVLRCTV